MNHPPIPEGHDRFCTGMGFQDVTRMKYHYSVTVKNGGGLQRKLIESLNPLERQDCAAHAAAWWYMQSDCEDGELKALEELTGHEVDPRGTAKDIAYAWLAWGKSNETESGE